MVNNIIILTVIEWIGTFGILIGLYYLNSKKASNPKIRIKGQIIVIIGCCSLGIFAFLIGAYGVMTTQIGVILVDIYGMYNCRKEVKIKC